MARLAFQVRILGHGWPLNADFLHVAEGNVRRLELVDHVLRIVRDPPVVAFVVLPTFCRFFADQSLLPLGEHDLRSLITRLVVFSVGALILVAFVEAPVWDVCVRLDRGDFILDLVAELLLLAEHTVFVLRDFRLVARHFIPVHFAGALVHRGFVEALEVLLLG